jgi:hypothetical protein
MPTPDFIYMRLVHGRVEVFLRFATILETPLRNRTLASDPGPTDQLGCGLPHLNKNNPRSAHRPLRLLYVLIYILFGAIFFVSKYVINAFILCPSELDLLIFYEV